MAALDYKKLLQEERRKVLLEMQREADNGNKRADESSSKSHSIERSSEAFANEDEFNQQFESIPHWQFNLPLLTESDFDLEAFRLDTLPALYYIPDIIDEESEKILLNLVEDSGNKAGRWYVLKTRRLQLWGKLPNNTPNPAKSNPNCFMGEKFPHWLEAIGETLQKLRIFNEETKANNVLINQYEKTQGIMHHTDGPSYHNRVVIFSLGSDCEMTFKPKLSTSEIGVKSDEDVVSVMLRARSLLIFGESLYEDYKHGIYADEEVNVIDQHAPCANKLQAHCDENEKVGQYLFIYLFIF